VTNVAGQVRDHPNRGCFIVENFDRTWKCFIPGSRIVSSSRGSLEEAFPIASPIHFNAVLIDERNPVQYIATLAWRKNDVLPSTAEMSRRDQPPDSQLIQLYRDYLDGKSTPPASAIKASSVYYEAAEAKVLRLLDDNFGVLEIGDKLVLFDTCDFWLDPLKTADKLNKKLPEIVAVGDIVIINAALVDDSATIQYLACAVWSRKDAQLFTERRPPMIKREAIHQQKLDIYKLVVQSVGQTFATKKPEPPARSEPREERWDKDIKYSVPGSVKCICYDSTYKGQPEGSGPKV